MLQDDFHFIESSPIHLITNELVVDRADASGGAAVSRGEEAPLAALMEEATFDVDGPMHMKVWKKTIIDSAVLGQYRKHPYREK